MNDNEWRQFLSTARRILGKGVRLSWGSDSWCAWTTFSSLECEVNYWRSGLPEEDELLDTGVVDGGTWGQPFQYNELAHVIIPATFYWEKVEDGEFLHGTKQQDILRLSNDLNSLGIKHRKTEIILEVKLY